MQPGGVRLGKSRQEIGKVAKERREMRKEEKIRKGKELEKGEKN